jgi:hypothetical protein
MNTPKTTPAHGLQDLQQYTNAEALTPALRGLCNHFGPVEKLVVLTAMHEGTKQAICFLRLASEDQEQALMKSLGAEKFGEEVVIVVDLKPTDLGYQRHPNMPWRSDSGSKHMALQAA